MLSECFIGYTVSGSFNTKRVCGESLNGRMDHWETIFNPSWWRLVTRPTIMQVTKHYPLYFLGKVGWIEEWNSRKCYLKFVLCLITNITFMWMLRGINEFYSESGRKNQYKQSVGKKLELFVLNQSVCSMYCALKLLSYIDKLFSESASGVPLTSSVSVIWDPNLWHYAQLWREISLEYTLIYCCLIYPA